MKIKAEVIEVSTNGETLAVTLQGGGRKDASWRRLGRHTLQVADTKPNRKAFHVGRIVKMEIEP